MFQGENPHNIRLATAQEIDQMPFPHSRGLIDHQAEALVPQQWQISLRLFGTRFQRRRATHPTGKQSAQ